MHGLARLSLVCVLLGAAAPVVAAPNLPFIEDDYGRALAEARSRKLPLFVESWAPW
jgi:endonuclease YncB( thermonuclease family)